MILVFCLITLLSTPHLCNSHGTQIQKENSTVLEKNSVTCKAIFYRPVQVLRAPGVKAIRISRKLAYECDRFINHRHRQPLPQEDNPGRISLKCDGTL